MSKKIRPGRVIADTVSNAIIVEYIIEKNGQVRLQARLNPPICPLVVSGIKFI